MTTTIEQALGTDFLMFYHSAIATDKLTPVCTLAILVQEVNVELSKTKNLSHWSAIKQNQIAKLLRANWIFQRLEIEPIRKPILVHPENQGLLVDCGDTRLMALSLIKDPPPVSVVAVTEVQNSHMFANWTPICTNQDLVAAGKFESDACIFLQTNDQGRIDWLEIGDRTTAHHLHDVDQRVAMMQQYLNRQSRDFEFTVEWARNYINWDRYANVDK